MKVKAPIIRLASDTPEPTRFSFWDKLKTQEEKDYLIQLMRKRGNPDWQPDEIIEVESPKEIVKIMQERPQGTQALMSNRLSGSK